MYNVIQDQITGDDNSISFGQTKPLRSYKEQITVHPSDFDNYLKKIAKVFIYNILIAGLIIDIIIFLTEL